MVGRVVTVAHELEIRRVIVGLIEVLVMYDRSLAEEDRYRSEDPAARKRPMEALVSVGTGLQDLGIAFRVNSPIQRH